MNDLLLEKLEKHPFVYHYTSVEALFSILEGYRRNIHTGCIPFRASCIYNINDPREMELGYEVVKKNLLQYEKEATINLNLYEVYNDSTYKDYYFEKYVNKPEDGLIEKGMVPYTLSFSGNRDFLPMWSMYGGKLKGVCLKFKTSMLFEKLFEGSQVDFVSYDEDSYIINEHFSLLYNWAAKNCDKTLTFDEKREELSMLCLCVSPFIKSRDWAYENEFRIVYNKIYGPKLDDDIGCDIRELLLRGFKNEKIKPYEYYLISANALDEIIIGPRLDYNVIEHIIKKELEECLLNNVRITPSSIAIN